MVEVFSTSDFDRWVRGLKDRMTRLRVVERLDRLASGNPGDVKAVGGGIRELRLMFGAGYRIYYLQDEPRVILLLCGGDKASQQNDIERARRLAEEYRSEEDLHHG